ncbi:MAG: hypothetical protein IJ652_07000 [Bacteroidales bacterium]|nr:hypothetical protein [Bacteroidales bacterium]
MLALVYNSKKGYTESFPIRAMRINAAGSVEVYIGTSGTISPTFFRCKRLMLTGYQTAR